MYGGILSEADFTWAVTTTKIILTTLISKMRIQTMGNEKFDNSA